MERSQETVQQPHMPTDSPKVVVVGNLTLDDVVLPDGTTRMASVGGNSLYAALGARLWQRGIGIVTRRGEDFPRDLDAELHALSIATDGVKSILGPTVRNWVIYETNGDRTWVYRTPRERSREVAVQPQDIPAEWLRSQPPPVVHVAAMPLDAAEAIVATVRRAAPATVITLDTHEDYVRDYRQRLVTLANRVDAFLPSQSELADLVGYDDPVRALSDLDDLSTSMIVVKMGASGALVWDRGRNMLSQVSRAVGTVVDVTGAGDAFCGGFAAGLSLRRDPVESAQYGAISASFAIGGSGCWPLTLVEASQAQAVLQINPPIVHSLQPPAVPREEEVPEAERGIRSPTDIMREEIRTIPRLIEAQLRQLGDQVEGLAQRLVSAGIENLYLTGCGDSAFAGDSVSLAFRQLGIHAEGIHAMEFARYRVRYLPTNSAVVAISFSGKVGRTIEAAVQAKRFGHRVIALTGNKDAPLAQQADDVLLLSVPTLGYSPGTTTYLALMTALLDLRLSWGNARGLDVTGIREHLHSLPELARDTVEQAEMPARELAHRLAGRPWITFLGAGPNLATARFGAAKLFEGPQMLGVATNLEEWAHEEYFISGAGTPVIMVAPFGASYDRATEILSELRYIDADSTFISDREPPIDVSTFIPLAKGPPEEFSPILAALPISLFAFHLTQAVGQVSFAFPTPEAAREHYDTIHRATVGEPA